MIKLIPTFLIVLTVSSAMAEPNDEPGTLNVMTWNIRFNNPRDGENAWPNRKDWVAEIIRREKADVIGLQEVLKGQLDDLTERMPGMEAYGVGRDDGKTKGEYSPLLYRRDRFELLAKSTFWLSKTPDVPGSKDWDAAITRIASWVKLKDKRTARVFYVINTHFDHVGDEARAQSAALLVKKLRQEFDDHPVILTGDFNTLPGTEPYVTLTSPSKEPGRSFQDAKSVSTTDPAGPDSTWCGFKEVIPGRRIDFIFVTPGVKVRSHRTLTDRREGRFPSDHLPVKAEVQLPGNQGD